MNSGNGDGIQACQPYNAALPGGKPLRSKIPLGQFLRIDTDAKCAPLATNNHHSYLGALGQVFSSGNKVSYPGPVGRVERLWAVEAQPCQVSINFAAHGLKFYGWHKELSYSFILCKADS